MYISFFYNAYPERTKAKISGSVHKMSNWRKYNKVFLFYLLLYGKKYYFFKIEQLPGTF